jgi:hypothetical protein
MNLTEDKLTELFVDAIDRRESPERLWFRHLAFEVRAVQGRPDLVGSRSLLHRARLARQLTIADALAHPSRARIAAFLQYRSRRTKDSILAATGLSKKSFANAFSELEATSVIQSQDDTHWTLAPGVRQWEHDLVAFELKLENWRRALYQVLRYQVFARETYVVLPTSTVHRAVEKIELFNVFGVGLLSIDADDGTIRCLLRSTNRKPASRFHYLFGLGKFLAAEDAVGP